MEWAIDRFERDAAMMQNARRLCWLVLPSLVAACHDAIIIGGNGGNAASDGPSDDGGVAYFADAAIDDGSPGGFDATALPSQDASAPDVALAVYAEDGATSATAYAYGDPSGNGTVYRVPIGTTTPVPLVSGSAGHDIGSLVVFDLTNAYFVSADLQADGGIGYSIGAVALQGGAPWTVAGGLGPVSSMVSDGTYLYFGQNHPLAFVLPVGEVDRVPVGGGAVEMLADQVDPVASVAVDVTDVYWATDPNYGGTPSFNTFAEIDRAAFTGGGPIDAGAILRVTGTAGDPRALAVENGNIYWLEPAAPCTGASGQLREVASGTAYPVTIVSNLAGPASLAVRDGTAYVAQVGYSCGGEDAGASSLDAGAAVASITGSVVAVSPSGVTTVLTPDVTGPDGLALVGPNLYYTYYGATSGSPGAGLTVCRLTP